MTAMTEFKIGNHIKKVIDKDEKMFKIMDLKEIKGGNWHDGFDISIVATIESIETNDITPETDTEDFCLQYINGMCQINNVYAKRVE